jgi:nudix-type nucleoside diphosphatase (YffH/AdpP family)
VKSEILSSEIIFHEFLKVEKTSVIWEKFEGGMGNAATRYVARRGDSVGIVPVCRESGNIILIKQFRLPAVRGQNDGYLWEIPAGMVDGNESTAQTAARELFEEIGLRAKAVEPLISFFLSPGLLDEKIHLFYALLEKCESLRDVGGNPEEQENLLIRGFKPEHLVSMIERGEIVDAKTISAILYYTNLKS